MHSLFANLIRFLRAIVWCRLCLSFGAKRVVITGRIRYTSVPGTAAANVGKVIVMFWQRIQIKTHSV